MRKILIGVCLISAAVSYADNNIPQVNAQNVLTSGTCSDLRHLVKSNHDKIKKAITDNDANTVGTIIIKNHALIHANLNCFPKLQQNVDDEKKLLRIYEDDK